MGLRKPEAYVVNFQFLDAAPAGSRAGFVHLGEELWRVGEYLKPEKRDNYLRPVHQRLSITIEQGDEENWWLILSCSLRSNPPPWTRRFVKSFEDALWAITVNPLQKV